MINWTQLSMPPVAELVGVARHMAAAVCAAAELPDHRVQDVRTCVSEAVTNAVHAHSRAEVPDPIVVRVGYDDSQVLVEVQDTGEGMGKDVDLPALMPGSGIVDRLAEGGYGLPVMQALADEVQVKSSNGGSGTRVRLCFRLVQDPAPT